MNRMNNWGQVNIKLGCESLPCVVGILVLQVEYVLHTPTITLGILSTTSLWMLRKVKKTLYKLTTTDQRYKQGKNKN